ncbi:MAG: hypothetical protein H6R14_1449 [Proteobacteria bacterium]|nr:hypothetical protein [Pseudomonadota bacterium]
MKADLSRATFDKARRYRSVRMQQGRVQLDADFNEQQDILNHRIEIETRDSLGPVAVPIDNPGFGLTPSGTDLSISAGRLYVDGLLCENPSATTVAKQPDLPDTASPVLPAGASLLPLPPVGVIAKNINGVVVFNNGAAVAPADGTYLAYLEAWQRHLSPLDLPVEDTSMREVALGGPDTCTREKTVWQVKLWPVTNPPSDINCLSSIGDWNTLTTPPDGRLAARAEASIPPKTPCQLPPEAGYRLLENHLYRVEIHDDATITGKARYKWSRDNGSIASRVVRWLNDPIADEFEVASIGRDDVLAISAGCWVEFYDDTHELLGQPGPLVPVVRTEGNVVTIDLSKLIGHALDKAMFPRNPRVRRWDGVAEIRTAPIANQTAGWEELAQDGIELKFSPGTYRIGDFWLIPARTATAAIEWPKEGGKPAFLAPAGVLRAFAKLALLEFKSGAWTPLSDCRPKFPSLTELTQLHYVGGDGQSVMPNPPPNKPPFVKLAQPLEVGVANGQFPVNGARVLFTAKEGQFPGGKTSEIVNTVNGIASIEWSLASDPTKPVQQATADLLLPGETAPTAGLYLPVHFTAQLSLASEVAYDPSGCPDLLNAEAFTVQKAIDELCKRPTGGGGCCVTVGQGGQFDTLDVALRELQGKEHHDICICLLPGDHVLKDTMLINGTRRDFIHIHGSGVATRLELKQLTVGFEGIGEIILEDMAINSALNAESIGFIDCGSVRLSRLFLIGASKVGNSLLRIVKCKRLTIDNCRLMALAKEIETTLPKLLKVSPTLMSIEDMRTYLGADRNKQQSAAKALLALNPNDRQKIADEINSALNGNDAGTLGPRVQQSLGALSRSMSATTSVTAIRTALSQLESALRTATPPFALAMDDVEDATLVDNEIRGRITLFGESDTMPDLEAAQRRRLSAAFAQGAINLSANGTLVLERNVFQGLRISGKVLETIIKKPAGDFPAFEYLQVSNNRIESDMDHYPGKACAFNGNRLNQEDHAGILFSSDAKIIGNFCSGEYSLFVVDDTPEIFGNGSLNIQPL